MGTVTKQVVEGTAPYWRLALEQRWKNQFFTIGTYGMQANIYTVYNKFNGAHSNYDGFGRNASNNNTLYALVWLMF